MTNKKKGAIIIVKASNMISNIYSPIEQKHTGKGKPNAILIFDVELNNRQQKLLEQLPKFDSRVVVPKNNVNMADLSALTAKTGDEFAMFTKSGERLIIRGNAFFVNVDEREAAELASQGYRWSGHTHPGDSLLCIQGSKGDDSILNCFPQKMSAIYNSKGQFNFIWKR